MTVAINIYASASACPPVAHAVAGDEFTPRKLNRIDTFPAPAFTINFGTVNGLRRLGTFNPQYFIVKFNCLNPTDSRTHDYAPAVWVTMIPNQARNVPWLRWQPTWQVAQICQFS